MPENFNENLTPGEEQLVKGLLAAMWAYDRLRLEWKALYVGRGENPTDRQMYLDAEKAVPAGYPADGLPSEEQQRAFLFLHAAEKLQDALEIARAEWTYTHGPAVLDEALRKLRKHQEETQGAEED